MRKRWTGFKYWAIVVAAIAAVHYWTATWRSVDPVAAAGMKPSFVKAIGEFARIGVISFVLARLVTLLGAADCKAALRLAICLWFGFFSHDVG